jgi:hypothetical protein
VTLGADRLDQVEVEAACRPAKTVILNPPAGRRSRWCGQGIVAMALIELRDVHEVYKRDAIEIPVLDACRSPCRRRLSRADGAVRVGQVDAAEPARRHRSPTRGSIRFGGTEISSCRSARWPRGARAHRLHLPALQPDPGADAFENVELPLLLTNLSKKQRRDT